jgi:hypothetical protein
MRFDFTRTIAAIAEYDHHDKTHDFSKPMAECMAWLAEDDRLAKAVGRAYGLDTSAINSVDTCEQCIRPGNKIPGPGQSLSFVRQMVLKG